MLPPPLRFLLRSFRLSSSARWLPCCRAAVAVAELLAAAAAGDTLRCWNVRRDYQLQQGLHFQREKREKPGLDTH